jgi:phosphatidylserine/phosphatidylglycerophosphate/cardiolipin synthase-like enzyme
VDLRLVVARPPDENSEPTYPAAENAAAVADAGLDPFVKWRTKTSGIAHNKFLILISGGEPRAVWTGSTNITDGAFYGQSNVGHLVRDGAVAQSFLTYWQELETDPTTGALRTFDGRTNPTPKGEPERRSVHAIFSPHRGEGVLRWIAERMKAARRSLFFTAPFGVSATLEKFLLAPHDFAAYVLLDKGDNHMDLLRAAGNELTAGAYLGRGAWHRFLREALVDHLNNHVKFIHTKYALVDPLSNDPVVIIGSANFSGASVSENDENMLVIRGNQRVADIYVTEFMRLFTHMYFRARTLEEHADGATPAPTPDANADSPLYLAPTDEWHRRWFDSADAHGRERITFR